ncbi:MAG: hypothetical protein KAS69_02620, partial [Planctomycetes bacterium]|nr:hypothetical protein [Planctomycetota bacterium]
MTSPSQCSIAQSFQFNNSIFNYCTVVLLISAKNNKYIIFYENIVKGQFGINGYKKGEMGRGGLEPPTHGFS